jgi:hypothetical protein
LFGKDDGNTRRNGRIILQEALERTLRLLSFLYDTAKEIMEEYTDRLTDTNRWTQADTQTAR